jgi:hypothetical protein
MTPSTAITRAVVSASFRSGYERSRGSAARLSLVQVDDLLLDAPTAGHRDSLALRPFADGPALVTVHNRRPTSTRRGGRYRPAARTAYL